MLSPVRLSVRPSLTWVDQSKTAEIRIMKFSPYGSPIYLYFVQGNFCPEIPTGSPERGRPTMEGWENEPVIDLHDSVSKTVRDSSKVTVND